MIAKVKEATIELWSGYDSVHTQAHTYLFQDFGQVQQGFSNDGD